MADETNPTDEDENEDSGSGLADRTEQLADLAIGKLRSRIQIQSIQEDASRTASTIRKLKSLSLKVIVALFLLGATSGIVIVLIGSPPIGRLPDWYMHVGMYFVLFTFLFLYIQAWQRRKAANRFLYFLASVTGIGTFVWILYDRMAPRMIIVDIEANDAPVMRGAMSSLWIPIVFLAMAGLGLLMVLGFAWRSRAVAAAVA